MKGATSIETIHRIRFHAQCLLFEYGAIDITNSTWCSKRLFKMLLVTVTYSESSMAASLSSFLAETCRSLHTCIYIPLQGSSMAKKNIAEAVQRRGRSPRSYYPGHLPMPKSSSKPVRQVMRQPNPVAGMFWQPAVQDKPWEMRAKPTLPCINPSPQGFIKFRSDNNRSAGDDELEAVEPLRTRTGYTANGLAAGRNERVPEKH